MAGPDDLYELAREFLDACAEAISGTDAGPIDFSFVSAGAPAFDVVPMLTVHLGGPVFADTMPLQPPLQPMQRTHYSQEVMLVNLTCTVVRPVPVLEQRGNTTLLPTVDDMNAAAKASYADVWAIWNHCRDRFRKGTLFASPSNRREFMFDAAVSQQTAGGASSWAIPIRVQLGGYA